MIWCGWVSEVVGISPPDALSPLADGASRTTGGPDETVTGRAREVCRFAPDESDSSARQVVSSLDVIMAASRTDIQSATTKASCRQLLSRPLRRFANPEIVFCEREMKWLRYSMHVPGNDDKSSCSNLLMSGAFAVSYLPYPVHSMVLTYHRSRRVSRSVNKLVVSGE